MKLEKPMFRGRPTPIQAYAAAIASVLLMILIRFAFIGVMPETRAPFMTLYVSVIFSAWYGGFGPAAFSTGLGTLYGIYMIERNPKMLNDPSNVASVVLFIVTSLCMAAFSISQKRSQAIALEAAGEKLDAEIKLRESEQTQRMQAEELAQVGRLQHHTNALLESLLANAPMGIAFFDCERKYVRINDYLARLKGISAADHVGHRVGEIIPLLGEQLDPLIQQVLDTGEGIENYEINVPGIKPNRHRSWIVGLYPIRADDGELEGVGAVGIEITRQKRVENEIRLLNQTLEDKVRERTKELLWANEELQGFTYSVSHDLRQPLRSIIASSRFILEDYGDKIDDEGKRLMQKQSEAAHRLANLIDDMLRYARLSRADLVAKPIDLGSMITDINESVAAQYQVRANIQITGETKVEGDPTMLRLAMENLVDNAYKYRRNDVPLEVSLCGKRHNGVVDFHLHDNGIGFDPAYADKLFQPFERLHRSEEYPGTGIGLANVRRVIKRHGGEISASSDQGHGACFCFSIHSAAENSKIDDDF